MLKIWRRCFSRSSLASRLFINIVNIYVYMKIYREKVGESYRAIHIFVYIYLYRKREISLLNAGTNIKCNYIS